MDTVNLETTHSDIMKTEYVKMRANQFKVVFLDIPENVGSSRSLDITYLEPIVNSAMKALEIGKILKKWMISEINKR